MFSSILNGRGLLVGEGAQGTSNINGRGRLKFLFQIVTKIYLLSLDIYCCQVFSTNPPRRSYGLLRSYFSFIWSVNNSLPQIRIWLVIWRGWKYFLVCFSTHSHVYNILRLFDGWAIFLSTQVKRSLIISNKRDILELPYELPNGLRLGKLENIRKISKLQRVIA